MTEKQNLLRSIAHNSPDHVPYFGEECIQFIDYKGGMPPEEGVDMWGVRWQKTEEDLLSYPAEHPIKSVVELLSYTFPDPHQGGLLNEAKDRTDKAKRLVVGRHITALFERYWALCGMDNALIWMLSHPEEVSLFFHKLADWQIEMAKAYISFGVDAGRISDDYGSQQDLLMSPELWRSIIKPELSRIVNYYKKSGCLVFLHSCGNIMRIMEDLVEMGIDVFNIQTSANDLTEIKGRYGRKITLMGGLDTQNVMTRGTPDLVKKAAIQAIRELGQGGGLILEPDQHIVMPEENIEALAQTVKQYGSYRAIRALQ